MNILVVGAGIIGAAIAEELAVRGTRVIVIDMRAPGRGASQASAGILAPFIESHGNPALLALGRRSLDLYDAFVARAAARSGQRVTYARDGTFEVALDEHDVARLQADRGGLESKGVASDWLDAAATRAFEPAVTPSAAGGLFIPAHGFVAVSQLVTALVSSARFAGAIYESSAEAVEIDPSRDHVLVRTGGDEFTADAVVIAAGSWSSRIRVNGATLPPVRPIRGQLLHLGWRPDAVRTSHVVWGPGCYTVPFSAESLLVGATTEDVGFDERSTLDGVLGLARAARELLPSASEASIDDVRVGLRPATPDHLPAIGRLERAPRVVVASGHFRNGALLAPVTAELVASLLIDDARDPLMEAVRPDRFNAR
jgi:glycine oxidase